MATRSTRGTTAGAPTRASTRTTRAASKASEPAAPSPAPTATRATRTATTNTGAGRSTAKAPAAKAPTAKAATTTKKAPVAKKASNAYVTANASVSFGDAGDREPIKAYLRIRPHLGDTPPSATPYLEHLSDTSVLMTDPSSPQVQSQYTFSHIFPPSTTQQSFFTRTTLPLVQGLLQGENGLLFAYGVTNSGKTYSVQGGNGVGSAGILPRTLDVVFNSVEGLQGEDKYVPTRLHAVEPSPPTTPRIFSRGPSLAPPSIASLLSLSPSPTSPTSDSSSEDTDSTVLKADKNNSYSVYLSYAEVYNEKIYDLLDDAGTNPSTMGGGGGVDQRLLLMRKALALKASPASDGEGPAGKYVAGLRQVRVRSASEAKELLRLGQLHRRVFGTLANSQSSRSHGIVTIKLLRRHRGEPDEPGSYLTSRLTLIDLAGSERTKHTLATGDRLREAGSINKSLMVLGQCMEVLRSNQRKLGQALGASIAHGEAGDTRDVRRNMAVVPFRHSKLTELLADYFTADGGGRAVMIVNVNPYDTGFDENAHVMRFSALAREVATPGVAQLPFPRLGRESPTKQSLGMSGIPRPNTQALTTTQHRRSVVLPPSKPRGRATEVTVVEEDAEEDEAEDEPLDPLVEALFDEVERMRIQLIAAHDRAALIEAETRAEVMRETQSLIAEMEAGFARRLRREVEQHEQKTDAKIDLLVRGSPVKRGAARVVSSDEEEEEEEEQEEIDIEASPDDDDTEEDEDEESREGSPLASRSGPRPSQIRLADSRSIQHHALPDDESAASDDETETATEDSQSRQSSDTEDYDDGEEYIEGVDEEDEEYADEDEEEGEGEDVQMQNDKTPRKPRPSPALNRYKPSSARGQPHLAQPPTPDFANASKGKGKGKAKLGAQDSDLKAALAATKEKGKGKSKVSALADELDGLAIGEEEWDREEDSMIVPVKKGPAKKKKLLGSKPVVTEEEIERAAMEVDAPAGRVKRLTRASAPRLS